MAVSLGVPGIKPAADRGVFAFGVFAKDEHVDAAGRLVAQRRLDAVEELTPAAS